MLDNKENYCLEIVVNLPNWGSHFVFMPDSASIFKYGMHSYEMTAEHLVKFLTGNYRQSLNAERTRL